MGAGLVPLTTGIDNTPPKCINLEVCSSGAINRSMSARSNGTNLRRLVEVDLAALGPYVAGGIPLKEFLESCGFGCATHVCQWLSESCHSCDPPDPASVAPYGMTVDLSDDHNPKLILVDAAGEVADGTDLVGVVCLDIHGIAQPSSGWRYQWGKKRYQ